MAAPQKEQEETMEEMEVEEVVLHCGKISMKSIVLPSNNTKALKVGVGQKAESLPFGCLNSHPQNTLISNFGLWEYIIPCLDLQNSSTLVRTIVPAVSPLCN
jgi:hypothetical protein